MASSSWSDLPKRLITLSIGAPFVILLLSDQRSAFLFFVCAHALCALEWIRLTPSAASISTAKKTDNSACVGKNEDTPVTPSSRWIFPLLSLATSMSSPQRISIMLLFSAALLYLSAQFDLSRFLLPQQHTSGSATLSSSPRDDKMKAILQASTRHCVHGLVYITLAFHHLILISNTSSCCYHAIYLLSIVWNSDTGALLFGRVSRTIVPDSPDVIGRFCPTSFMRFIHKISPSKSITGIVGALCLGVATAVTWPSFMSWLGGMMRRQWPDGNLASLCVDMILSPWWEMPKNSMHQPAHDVESALSFSDLYLPPFIKGTYFGYLWKESVLLRRAVIGLVLSVAAIIGDLVESAVKREAGKKDSGKLLPGHGGLLDRFDSTFLSAAVYWHWCLLDKNSDELSAASCVVDGDGLCIQ